MHNKYLKFALFLCSCISKYFSPIYTFSLSSQLRTLPKSLTVLQQCRARLTHSAVAATLHTVTQPHCHTAHSNTATLQHNHTAPMPQCHTAHSNTAPLPHSPNATHYADLPQFTTNKFFQVLGLLTLQTNSFLST